MSRKIVSKRRSLSDWKISATEQYFNLIESVHLGGLMTRGVRESEIWQSPKARSFLGLGELVFESSEVQGKSSVSPCTWTSLGHFEVIYGKVGGWIQRTRETLIPGHLKEALVGSLRPSIDDPGRMHSLIEYFGQIQISKAHFKALAGHQ